MRNTQNTQLHSSFHTNVLLACNPHETIWFEETVLQGVQQ